MLCSLCPRNREREGLGANTFDLGELLVVGERRKVQASPVFHSTPRQGILFPPPMPILSTLLPSPAWDWAHSHPLLSADTCWVKSKLQLAPRIPSRAPTRKSRDQGDRDGVESQWVSASTSLWLSMTHRESLLEVPGNEVRVGVRKALPGRWSTPSPGRSPLLPASASPSPLQGFTLLRAGSRRDAIGALLSPQPAGLGRGP